MITNEILQGLTKGNASLYVNGVKIGDYNDQMLTIEIRGSMNFVHGVDLEITGNVYGDVDCTNLTCANITGNVDATNVTCGNVAGNVDAVNVNRR